MWKPMRRQRGVFSFGGFLSNCKQIGAFIVALVRILVRNFAQKYLEFDVFTTSCRSSLTGIVELENGSVGVINQTFALKGLRRSRSSM